MCFGEIHGWDQFLPLQDSVYVLRNLWGQKDESFLALLTESAKWGGNWGLFSGSNLHFDPCGEGPNPRARVRIEAGSGQGAVTGLDAGPLGKHWEAGVPSQCPAYGSWGPVWEACTDYRLSACPLTSPRIPLHTESEGLSQEISTPMPRGWPSFDEVDSGQLQGQDSLGPETPRVRKGKAPSTTSTRNCVKSWLGWSGNGGWMPQSLQRWKAGAPSAELLNLSPLTCVDIAHAYL